MFFTVRQIFLIFLSKKKVSGNELMSKSFIYKYKHFEQRVKTSCSFSYLSTKNKLNNRFKYLNKAINYYLSVQLVTEYIIISENITF